MARAKDLADTIDVLLTSDQWQRHSVEWVDYSVECVDCKPYEGIKLLVTDDEGTRFIVTVEYEGEAR